MPVPDDFGLDPQRSERIRSRAVERGEQLRKRTRLARRSAIVAGLAVLAAGGVAVAAAGAPSAQNLHSQGPIGPSTTSTTTTLPAPTSTPPSPTTSTTPDTGQSTTTVPVSTTVPPTTTTTPAPTTIPGPKAFAQTLQTVVAAGTIGSVYWTVRPSETAEIGTFTVHNTGSGLSGQLRVQLSQPHGSPQTLLGVSLAEVTSSFTVSLATDVVVPAGDSIQLTVTCQADQAACQDKVTFSGEIWPSPHITVANESGELEDVVPPGSTQGATWTVPAGESFDLTDLLLSSLGSTLSTPTGLVKVEVLRPGAAPRTILSTQLAALDRRPTYVAVSPSITLAAGEQLSLTVSCNPNQAACNVTTFYSGSLSPAS